MGAPIIQVGIDWDNDGVIQWDGDRPNQLEDAPYGHSGIVYNFTNSQAASYQFNQDGVYADADGGVGIGTLGGIVQRIVLQNGVANSCALGRNPLSPTNVGATHRVVIPPGPNQNIFGSFLVRNARAAFGTATLTFNARVRTTPSGAPTGGTSAVVPLSTEWQRVEWSVSSRPPGTYYITPEFTSSVIGPSNLQVEFMDFMVVTSTALSLSTPLVYSPTGVAQIESDITPYVLEASWSLGSQDSSRKISESSTAEITLDNSSGAFLPNGSGTYSSVMNTNLRAIIRLYDPAISNFRTMWTGVVTGYEIVPKTNPLEQRVTIMLQQDIYSLRSSTPTYDAADPGAATVEKRTSWGVLKNLIQRNGINVAFPAPSARVGVSKLGRNSYLLEERPFLYYTGGEYQRALKYVGYGWGSRSFTSILKAIIDTEQGWLFSDRNGRLIAYTMYQRRKSHPDETPVDLNLNDIYGNAHGFEVSYGKNLVTAASIDYLYTARPEMADLLPVLKDDTNTDREDDEEDFSLYWGKKTNVGSRAWKKLKGRLDRIAIWNSPTFVPPLTGVSQASTTPTERTKLESLMRTGGFPEEAYVLDYNPTRMDIISIHSSQPLSASGTLSQSVVYAANTTGGAQTKASNNGGSAGVWNFNKPFWRVKPRNPSDLVLWLMNDGTYPATMEVDPVAVRGVVNIIGEREKTFVRSTDPNLAGITPRLTEVTDTLLTERATANSLANLILADYGSQTIEVERVKISVADDQHSGYNKIMLLEVGSMVNLTEWYTGLSDALHIVVGEKHVYKNQTLSTELVLHSRENALDYIAALGFPPNT